MILHIPTKIIMEENCIKNNSALFESMGKKAFLVTYVTSQKNGLLSDITSVVPNCEIFLNSPQNPTLEDAAQLGKLIRKSQCDYIIAAGGGSVIDIAKAIALLATNPITAEDLYKNSFEKSPLPIIAIPTTCGTGSEVTPVSVLTVGKTKLSFSNEGIIPKIALLDEKYIDNLPLHIKRQTAVDAFCHCVEGYLTFDDMTSDMFSHNVFEIFGKNIHALINGEFNKDIDKQLLYMGTLGGLSINITRTAAPHAMGYVLTVKEGLPHGLACGLLISSYVKFSYETKKAKIDAMLKTLNLKNIEELNITLKKILDFHKTFSIKDIEYFTEVTYKAATGKPNPKPMTKIDVFNIYKEALNIE